MGTQSLSLGRHILRARLFDLNRVQMDVAGDFLQIIVLINQEGMIAALIKMTRATMPPIEPGRVGDIEVPHELLEISPRGFHQEMKVVTHQGIGEDLGLVNVRGASQQIEKGEAVGIGGKDMLSVVTATGYMIIGILELDPKWPCHASKCMVLRDIVKDKDLTPILTPKCPSNWGRFNLTPFFLGVMNIKEEINYVGC
jgi:hypothetical protein